MNDYYTKKEVDDLLKGSAGDTAANKSFSGTLPQTFSAPYTAVVFFSYTELDCSWGRGPTPLTYFPTINGKKITSNVQFLNKGDVISYSYSGTQNPGTFSQDISKLTYSGHSI